MSALDGFYSTWNKAKDTFGVGTPTDGSQYNGSSSQLLQMKSSIESASKHDGWQGTGADAYAAANKEHAGVYQKLADLDKKMAAEVTNAANVVTNGRNQLDTTKSWVDSAVNSLPSSLSAQAREKSLIPIANQGITQVNNTVENANKDMNTIAGRFTGLRGEFDSLTNQKFAPGEKKEGPIDPNDLTSDKKEGSEDPALKERARKDVDAALNGDRDAQQRVRDVLNTIDDDQQTGHGELKPEQSSYLSQMAAQQKLRTVDQLTEAANNGAEDIMSNSWQLMSNPEIEFPKTESRDGALQSSELTKGSFDQLPDSVKSAIQSPGIEQSDNLQKIADIVNAGNGEKFQHNTDIDRGLMHKVANMMESPLWRSDDAPFRLPGDINLPGTWDDPRPPHASLEKVASDVMNGIHNDHQVIHDAVTGKVEPGNDFRDKFKVDSDHLMYNLTHEAWDDHGIGAGEMFRWMDDSANGPEAQIAGETARSVSEYLGNNPGLNSLNSDNTVGLYGTHSLGEVNWGLTQGMAEGLTPYVNNIAGTDGGLSSFGGMLDDADKVADGTLPEAKNLFSVLNTDPEAAKIINGAALGQALLHDTAYAEHPISGEKPHDLYDSATLRALVDVGLENNIDTTNKNQAAIDTELYQAKSAAFDLGLDGLTKAADAGAPGAGGITSEALSTLGPAVKDSIIGPEPPDPGEPAPIARFAAGRAEAEMLNSLHSVGTPIVDLPESYRDHGRIRSFEEMYARDTTMTPGVYAQVLSDSINHTLGFDFQDTHYKTRYDDVVANKTPDPNRN